MHACVSLWALLCMCVGQVDTCMCVCGTHVCLREAVGMRVCVSLRCTRMCAGVCRVRVSLCTHWCVDG